MSSAEKQEYLPSETEGIRGEDEGTKLVPVSESIRYRKRAQSAEKKAEALAEQLAEAREQVSRLTEKLSNFETEQELARRLAAAGAVDLEAAVLVAKGRLEADRDRDIDSVIEQLKKEKGYLFASLGEGGQACGRRLVPGTR